MLKDMLTQLKNSREKAEFYLKNSVNRTGRILTFNDEEIKLVAEKKKINISELSRIEVVDEKENLKTDNRLEMVKKARSIEQGFER